MNIDLIIAEANAGYKICWPGIKLYPYSADIIYESEILYEQTLQEAIDYGLMSESDVLALSILKGMWDDDKEERLAGIPNQIDDLKVQMFECITKSNTREALRCQVKDLYKEYSELSAAKNHFYYYGAESYAEMCRIYFMVKNSVRNADGSLYDPDEGPYSISDIIGVINKTSLNEERYREVARHHKWRSHWSGMKKTMTFFPLPLSELQKNLMSWSSFYDNIYELHDCPDDSVLSDDYVLDGFIIKRNRESNKVKMQNSVEQQIHPKMKKSQEIFLVAESLEDIKRINSMNDFAGKAQKASRFKQLESKGTLREVDFKDVQDKLRMQATQQFRDRFRK